MSCCGGNCGCGTNCGCGSSCKGCKMYPEVEGGIDTVDTPQLSPEASEMGKVEEKRVGGAAASEGGEVPSACKCSPCNCSPCNC